MMPRTEVRLQTPDGEVRPSAPVDLAAWLASYPDRCDHGFHRTAQSCPTCKVVPPAGPPHASRRRTTPRGKRLPAGGTHETPTPTGG